MPNSPGFAAIIEMPFRVDFNGHAGITKTTIGQQFYSENYLFRGKFSLYYYSMALEMKGPSVTVRT